MKISQMNNQTSLQMRDDFENLPSLYEREEHMVAAAQHMVKLLATHRHANDHLRKLLADLDTQLAAMKLLDENKTDELNDIKERLILAEEKIKAWGSNQGMTWDSCPDLFSDYLGSVDEVRRLAGYSRSLASKGKADCEETIQQAENALQIGMSRIEDELRDIFAHSLQSCIASTASSCCEEEVAGSVTSDESLMGSSRRESSSSGSERYVVADMVSSDTIPVIKSISVVMFSANYDKEFCKAIESSQKEALDEFLLELGFQRFTIEELTRMDWKILDSKIKTWIRAVKIFVQVYLVGEKRLLEQIFEEVGPMDPSFFANIASPTMTCLLNFGQGVAVSARRPEKLFAILNMVEVLRKVNREVSDLFCNETTSSIKMELQELTAQLGSAAKATFLEFGALILSDPSVEPFHAGRIHHLTKYVMNYLNTVPAYKNILNLLLEDNVGSDFLVNGNHFIDEEDETSVDDSDSLTSCLVAVHLRSIVDKLESNLENKARLYRDSSLRHIFLLNNIHYIVQKVTDSDLRAYFGDDWIRKRMSVYQHEATCYFRSTWGPVVPLLLDEAGGSGSGSSKSTATREKLRSFTAAFEEIYRVQTGWLIRDEDYQLKQELRISITQRLVPAYQNFVTKCKKQNLEKHVKYEADDLVDLINDLFEGIVKSLNSTWRR